MVTFILKEPNGDVKTLIYLAYYNSGRMMKYSTGHHVLPTQWNKVAHRVRKGAFGSGLINKDLDKLQTKVKEIHLRLTADLGRFSPNQVRKELEKELLTGSKRETFIEFCERFTKERGEKEAEQARKNKTKLRYSSTYKIYKTTLKHLKGFPGAKDFEDIDSDWLEKFTSYLEGQGKAANTIGKNTTYVKIFLNEATDQGVNKQLLYKSKKYKKRGEEVESIYLTENELLNMYGIDPLPPYFDRARDRFMIGAFTGLRYSDFSNIEAANIANGLIIFKTQKTNEGVVIPVHWVVMQILEKYKDRGGLPPSISNQKMNTYLKSIAARAGIKEVVVKHRTQGGVRTQQALEKWKLVSTHTARRSFATNAYIAGVPSISIMKITGHRTERSFMKYIRISQHENAVLMQSHHFFQPPGK